MQKFKNALRGKLPAVAGVGSAALATGSAFASGGGGVDVSEVISAISAAAVPIASIGSAVLTVLVGIKVYKWVRGAL
ncbi:major capsid protein [Stenotrophomonas sp. NLF4-10]|uniref:major capsid protein n=1 Tax=Stenotrophomonas sp. NLF4-10 TaxID=2918754 RepID=UPI001EFB7322|nr:major capsid protein [Stenotrophomonas sp. NLF4-10]MCG8276630.1 major capsid protein [Stenotrophomonas sp. NLF4-10]